MTASTSEARSERVFLVGYYGVANLGDEAIRMAIERAAPRLGAEVVAYASRTADPDPRAVRTGFRALPAQVRAIRAADRVVLGGGGILKDEGLRLPAELLVTAGLARLLGRRVTLLGVGVGPFYHRVGRWLVWAVARLAQVRTVRDADSATALRELGIGRVQVGADPIFSTDSEPDGPGAGSSDVEAAAPATGAGDDAGPRRAVVSIRPWFHKAAATERDARQATLRGALAAALRPLARAGWRLELVALYWPRDRDASRELVAAMADGDDGVPTDASLVVDEALGWDALVTTIRRADLVIAMRYHAVAASALAGRSTIAVAYEPKVRALAETLGIVWHAVDDPALATALARDAEAAAGGVLPGRPDGAAVDRLRRDAWTILRAALRD